MGSMSVQRRGCRVPAGTAYFTAVNVHTLRVHDVNLQGQKRTSVHTGPFAALRYGSGNHRMGSHACHITV
eukprot:7385830-Prymnesium_polylepis.1